MAHNITAVIGASVELIEQDTNYDLPFFDLGSGFHMMGLDSAHSKYWTEKIGSSILKDFPNGKTAINFDIPVIHYWANKFFGERYALIQTEYFGGEGDQWAAFYESLDLRLFAEGNGAINKILRKIGVYKASSYDEFEALNLVKYRNFGDHFRKYY